MKYVIDAKGKALGRVASEAASLLTGKAVVAYKRNVVPAITVHVENASKIKISSKKLDQTEFRHHSGYRGGLKAQKISDFISKKGHKELMRKTVYGMLPINKLRRIVIKNLFVSG